MIGTIRHHQKWLWAVIILATIISFVYFFTPGQRLANSESGKQDFGTINSRRITRAEMGEARAEAKLLYFLRAGAWPGNDAEQKGFDLERETYSRLALIEKMEELKLRPDADATADWIKEAFGSTNGTFPMERFEGFVKTELTPNNLTEEDFSRFARHQVGQQHLISVYGLSGKLITAQEVEVFYRQLNEPLVTEAVLFSASNYVSSVPSTPALIGEYFTNNISDYRLPERMQINYVEWDLTNFYPEVDQEIAKNTNFSQQIDAAYLKNGANLFKDESGNVLSADAAKNKMRTEYRRGLAQNAAAKKANELLTDLANGHDENNPYKIEDLEKAAKAKGLAVKTTPPFDQRDMVKLKLSPQFVQTAFRLRDDDPEDKGKELLYSLRPIPGEKAVYAIGFKKRLPSELQSLETVRKQAEKDYLAEESLKLARAAGTQFEKTLTDGIAQGKTFAAVCEAAKVKPVTLPTFSLSTQAHLELPGKLTLDSLQGTASALAEGQASPFVGLTDGGYVLHLKSKLPVDEAKMKIEFPEFLARQREQRMYAAFSDWFQKFVQDTIKIPAKIPAGKS